jgi:2-(1,2-epoxy-1,2-dihydrophenyl)acetyl-CoA isomerase
MPLMTPTLPELATVSLRLTASNRAALRIELARPERMNAWNDGLVEDLGRALEVAADPAVRCVTISGAGRAFSAGADLREGFRRTPEGHPDLEGLLEHAHPVLLGIGALEKPVVAVVGGPAVGVGCSLALACDLVLASASSYFLLAFVNIGLTPDGGSSVFVPNRTGFGRAMEMALLGERIGAEQALAWGLANRVVADDELADAADALAERLATGPTRAYAATKRRLRAWADAGLAEGMRAEAKAQQELAATHDFTEGVAAFLERRAPAFEGH